MSEVISVVMHDMQLLTLGFGCGFGVWLVRIWWEYYRGCGPSH